MPPWITGPALLLPTVFFSWPVRAQDPVCGAKAQSTVNDASALVGKAVPCRRINATAGKLKAIAKDCAGTPVGDRAATLRFELLAQVCVTASSAPKPPAAPGVATPRPPAPTTPKSQKYPLDELISEAGEHVDDLRKRIVEERPKCPADGPCSAVELLEKEQVEATIAFLQLTTRRESGFGEARKLLVGALASDPHDLLAAIAQLQAHGLAPAAAAKVAADMVAALATSAKDSAIFQERFEDLFASVSAEGPGGVKRASKLLQALKHKGMSTTEAQGLLAQFGSLPQGVQGRSLDDIFRLAAFVNDPEVLRQWKASLDWLFGKGGAAPPELRHALAKEKPDPKALLDIINRMNAEQAKALVDYAAVVAHREEELRQRDKVPRTPRNSYIIFSGVGTAGDSCSAQQGFRSAVEEFLTQASPVGIRQPVSIPGQDPEEVERTIEEALCMCRHKKSCPGTTIPAIEGRCEGVLAVRFESATDAIHALGSLRFVSTPADESGKVFQVSEFQSPVFPAGCDPDARRQQKEAAIALIRDLERRAVAFQLFPRLAVELPRSQQQPPSRWNALVLSGLPQLRDSYEKNDTLGWTLAGVDLALATCAATSGILAYRWRNDYANGSRSSLNAANAALGTATGCLLVLGVERMTAALTYWP